MNSSVTQKLSGGLQESNAFQIDWERCMHVIHNFSDTGSLSPSPRCILLRLDSDQVICLGELVVLQVHVHVINCEGIECIGKPSKRIPPSSFAGVGILYQ